MKRMSPLRALLFTDPLVILATIAYGTAAFLVSFFDATGSRQIAVARAWSRALLRIGFVHVEVEGLEKIAPNGSYVLASNHLSYMDTPVVLSNIPVQFRFLAKSGLFQIPFLGTHLARAGHIPVPREDPRAAVKTLTTAADAIRARGISMLIFPEGGRSRDGVLQEFKEGGAYIAIKAGVPLVPIALSGTRAVLPFGSAIIRPGRVRMRVGDPIPTAGLTLRDRVRLTAQVHDEIVAMLDNKTHAHA
jgi:1-acyl-sn-glycerol-3-phosphate acyltransferase